MAKQLTWQQKKAQEQAERAKQIQAEAMERYRIAEEQERLYNEQLATRTPEEIEQEQQRWEADRQVQIETARKRSQEVERHPYQYVYEDDEE